MVQYLEKYKKNIATEMREKGMSYSEIQRRINVPKSTLSFWLKKIKLSETQEKRLNDNRLDALNRGVKKRVSQTAKTILEIKKSSAKDIHEISKRELWLIGIVLYWRERFLSGNDNDLRKGVRFTCSDPYLVKLFLKWLKDIGGIKDEEIALDIFLGENRRRAVKEIVKYWAEVTGVSEEDLTHVYIQKVKTGKKRRNIRNKTSRGLLRVRVKSSSMLARQIAGWVRGVIGYYWA